MGILWSHKVLYLSIALGIPSWSSAAIKTLRRVLLSIALKDKQIEYQTMFLRMFHLFEHSYPKIEI